jgi:hypothetical protein
VGNASLPNSTAAGTFPGGPIVSFDGGKTWKWETPTTTIKKVSVQWVKVME